MALNMILSFPQISEQEEQPDNGDNYQVKTLTDTFLIKQKEQKLQHQIIEE